MADRASAGRSRRSGSPREGWGLWGSCVLFVIWVGVTSDWPPCCRLPVSCVHEKLTQTTALCTPAIPG